MNQRFNCIISVTILLKYRLNLVLLLLVLLIAFPTFGQNNKRIKAQREVEKAISAYQSGNINLTRSAIEKAISLDSTYIDSYMFVVDLASDGATIFPRRKALLKIIELSIDKPTLAVKLLANDYFEAAEYSKAILYYNQYSELCALCDTLWISKQIQSCRFALNSKSDFDFSKFNFSKLDTTINTSENEYWPAISADDSILYFTRLESDEYNRKVERIYSIKRLSEGFDLPRIEFDDQSGLVNRGAMSVSSDGKMLFYTACGQPGGKGSCDIYMVVKINGKWSEPRNVGAPINTSFWEAQPSISADGRWLYFSSNRTGGVGGMDIWVSEITQPEPWVFRFSEPQNLGRKVNTPFDDSSPFIHANGSTLYFASNGWPRFGKNDLYQTQLGDNQPISPINLGSLINTASDEFGLVVSSTGAHAYFVSDRDGTRDLFEFTPDSTILKQKVSYLKGFVRNVKTQAAIDAKITIVNLKTAYSWYSFSDQSQGYLITLNQGESYAVNVVKEGFLMYSNHIDISAPGTFLKPQWFDIDLVPVETNHRFVLNNIFFDFNSSALKTESFIEIEKLIQFLKANPNLHVEVGGHTDNVGGLDYNQKLSEQRAKAIAYEVSKQIDGSKVTYKGYGALQPMTSNETEEGRAQNRRSEIKVTAIN